jgi:acyl carrier protein
MNNADALRRILSAQLGPTYPPSYFAAETPLLGTIPELDSMAVVGILTALEEELGIHVEDDEISAEVFATFSTLVRFVFEKVGND